MPELLDRPEFDEHAETTARPAAPPVSPFAPATESDERAARRTLLDQIARLGGELDQLFCTTFPRQGYDWGVSASMRGGRILPMGELERMRDALAARLADNRLQLDRRALVEERNRARREEMLLEPERFKFQIISNEDIGEPGCHHWHSLPRYGVLGMFMNWWRVRISSGCPLAEGRGLRP